MPSSDGSMFDLIGILAVLALVVANGFFVAAEFSLVAVRRSRVAELVSARRTNATALQRAVDNLDAYLAVTQLGITISSLALGWIGEPALAHLIEPLLSGLPESLATTNSHAVAVAIAFVIGTPRPRPVRGAQRCGTESHTERLGEVRGKIFAGYRGSDLVPWRIGRSVRRIKKPWRSHLPRVTGQKRAAGHQGCR